MKNPRRDFGSSLLISRDKDISKYFRDAKIDKVNSRSDDINESEPARVVKQEMFWSSRGCIGSIKFT